MSTNNKPEPLGFSCQAPVTQEKRSFNKGLALLRVWMCFEVVFGHCTPGQSLLLNQYFFGYAVPVFMIMSFFLTDSFRLSSDPNYRKRRILRLLTPQIFWAFAYWGFYNLTSIVFHSSRKENIFSLLWQIGFGYTFNGSMWFQSDLIFITLLFALILALPRKITLNYILPFIFFTFLCMSYMGLNQKIVTNLPEEMSTTVSCLFGMIPLAITGIYLKVWNFPEFAKNKKTLFPLLLALLFFLIFAPFSHCAGGSYNGLPTIAVPTLLIILFYALPLNSERFRFLHSPIQILSKYTMGVYCIHRMIRHIFRTVTNLESRPVIFSALVFLASWAVCFIIGKLPWKWAKASVS